MNIEDFTLEELKAEIQRRDKEKKDALVSLADHKKRMNIAIKKEYSKETESEITAAMLMEPEYENNIQKALTWGLIRKSQKLVETAIKAYKDFSAERYFSFVPFGVELEDILFIIEVDVEAANRYLEVVLSYWVENELQLLKMKHQGGVEHLYHEWHSIDTGYDREIHRVNRKKINDVLERAKESYPYCRIFRKSILRMLWHAESCEQGDFKEAVKFLRWSGARWGRCSEK